MKEFATMGVAFRGTGRDLVDLSRICRKEETGDSARAQTGTDPQVQHVIWRQASLRSKFWSINYQRVLRHSAEPLASSQRKFVCVLLFQSGSRRGEQRSHQ